LPFQCRDQKNRVGFDQDRSARWFSAIRSSSADRFIRAGLIIGKNVRPIAARGRTFPDHPTATGCRRRPIIRREVKRHRWLRPASMAAARPSASLDDQAAFDGQPALTPQSRWLAAPERIRGAGPQLGRDFIYGEQDVSLVAGHARPEVTTRTEATIERCGSAPRRI
jgi:hypothetical protein